MPSTTPPRFAAGARWGLVAVTWVLGAALVVAAWLSKERIDEASELLVRGQAEAFWQAARQLSREGAPSSDELRAFLDDERDAGLRYVAIFTGDGREMASAGTALPGGGSPPRGPTNAVRVGPRYRVTAPLPHVRSHRRYRPFEPRWRGPGPHRMTRVVLEFEPRVSDALRADAARDFAFSSAAAIVLALSSLVLWWLLRQREEQQAASERERRLALLGEMSAVMAHEMRNPLASLKGHAQLLVEQLDDGSKTRRKAERVVSEAERLEVLSGDLLDFVRSGTIERRNVSPADIARQAAESLDVSRLDIDVTQAPETWPLDPLRMQQVFTNLFDNALKASPPEAPVEVRLALTDGRLSITVRDRGPGIEPGDEQRIFDAFVTQRVRGTGLGLAIARRIVELHDGTIEAANHPDGGAVFTVSIPE